MNRLRELRMTHDMRQSDLAKLLNTKPQTVSRYEKEDRGLDVETICRLCDIFGCTSDYLLGRSPVAKPELTPEEENLLMAWRRSDDRAKDIVAVTLAPFQDQEQKSKAI